MKLFGFLESGLFRADSLAWLMAGLILFVIGNVAAFSTRYLAGDRNRHRQFAAIAALGVCATAMAFADHLLVLLAAWAGGNLMLVRLMIHKQQWSSARASGCLALKTFCLGFTFLAGGFWLLAETAGSPSIAAINAGPGLHTRGGVTALLLIALAAMTQSALWPFHRWLTSSLNSPTPVSALMHAGLVNGGGFLLARFAPLYAAEPSMLHALFVAGLFTAIVGTFWKLLQTDIKRMLACSTMGQMGFMFMQCGMGLFAPAVSHLVWHGLFKAYLFLSAGSAVQEKRGEPQPRSLSPVRLLLACLVGAIGAAIFAAASGTSPSLAQSGCLMIALAFMASTQLAAGLLDKSLGAAALAAALLAGAVSGGLYGLSVRLIEGLLAPLHITSPQPLDAVYITGFALVFLVWIAMLVNLPGRLQALPLWNRLYMSALNASQPHPKTVTANRSDYQS